MIDIFSLPIDKIDANPYQPRKSEDMQTVKELVADILHHATDDFDGLMQIPTVRAVDGRYQLAFGHTRRAAFAELASQGHTRYSTMRANVRELTDVQMFELAVAENIKRKDLNPIEQAEAMHRYMTDFGKTSKEAGEFFNCSEENVRAKVRLLKLPEPVVDRVRAGEINENTARSLLSMQKVAPTSLVEVTRQIEKAKGERLPEEIIEDELERSDSVRKMWDSDMREGKPRSNYSDSDGWLLDMKNFPNKLLPALTYREVINSIHASDDPQLIELVNLNNSFHGLYEVLKQFHRPEAAVIDHLLNPPACSACPFYTKVRGSHYCGIKACHARKTLAWHENAVQQASKSLGIAIYEKTDGPYAVLSTWDDKHKKLFDEKHKDLRLLRASECKEHNYQSFKGVDDDAALVVITGATLVRMAAAKSGNVKATGGLKKSDKEKLEMRRMKIFRVRRKDLTWAFTDATRQIFDGVPLEAVKQFIGWKFVGIDDRIPDDYEPAKDASAEEQDIFKRRELIWHMVIAETSSHYRREPMSDVLGSLKEYADSWGVKLPKAIHKLASDFDAEIEAVTLVTGKAAK